MQEGDPARAFGPQVVRRLPVLVLVGLGLAPALLHQLEGFDPARMTAALGAVGPAAWALALLASWVSYLAVASYDQVMHRHLHTGVAEARAGRAGFAALAIGQTVGLGVLSGAMVRWRLLPELGAKGALALSIAVSASFFWAWAVLTGVAVGLLPTPFALPKAPVLAGLLVLAAALASLLRLRGAPNLLTQWRILLLTAVDCLAACAAFWAFLPPGIGFAEVVPVFLVAMGAGLLSGVPGGLGAFELVLLAGLPQLDAAPLLAAALGWRLVYLALPALLGAALVVHRGPKPPAPIPDPVLPRQPLPEVGLIGQGALLWHREGFLAGRTAHALVALGAEVAPETVTRAAEGEGRVPVLYKLSARAAARARRAGFRVLPVAAEAWLDPATFTPDCPACAGLRRKLRRAEAAGIVAGLAPAPDRSACTRVNAAWVAARGAERGFSMGRFQPGGLGTTPTVVACQGAHVVGFATFLVGWEGRQKIWRLDLLRPDPAAPDGTAQALIIAALAAARRAGVDRLSLAAVPMASMPGETGLIARLERRLFPGAGEGLQQFKASFAPRWQRRYIAAPGWLWLALTGVELAREILRPPPLPPCDMKPGPSCDAEYEFASASAPWQREQELAS